MSDASSPGLRRARDEQSGDRLADADAPGLRARIAAEIRGTGPMTFARFMELALYDPDAGYYASGTRGPGRSGDFLTAPESHPLFGWAMARQLEDAWDRLGRPERFTVREHGAGAGALAAGVIDGLRRSGSALERALRYRIVEPGRERPTQVRERIAATGVDPDVVLEPDDGSPIVGAVLANEVLDALPVHRVVGRADGDLDEVFVEVEDGDRLVDRIQAASTPRLAARLAGEGISLAPGQRAEVCLALDAWLTEAAAGLAAGLLLLIDYGHDARSLYDPARGSLLRAYSHHRVHDDPYRALGRQDLTAHVDLTAVAAAARDADLTELGATTQAQFLAALGAGELLVGLQDRPGVDLQAYLEARSALVRMLDPSATGGFAVRAFGRGLDPEPALRGFTGPALGPTGPR